MLLTRRRALGALAAGGAGLLGAGGYGVLVERHRLGVTRVTLPLHRLPPGLDGLRVGLATDFHYGRFTGDEMLAAVARSLADERLDLVLLGGDFVTWSERAAVAPCAAALAGVGARHGVFAVFGNHDPEATVKAVFERRGIGVLRDEHTRLDVRGEPVALAGLKYWSRSPADLARAFRGSRGFPILLAHDPRRVGMAAAAAVPLVLSGHTHGGQVVVPGLGAPAAGRYPVVYGLARREGTALFVSRGIGTVAVPVRFNCPPEVVVLTLRAFSQT